MRPATAAFPLCFFQTTVYVVFVFAIFGYSCSRNPCCLCMHVCCTHPWIHPFCVHCFIHISKNVPPDALLALNLLKPIFVYYHIFLLMLLLDMMCICWCAFTSHWFFLEYSALTSFAFPIETHPTLYGEFIIIYRYYLRWQDPFFQFQDNASCPSFADLRIYTESRILCILICSVHSYNLP